MEKDKLKALRSIVFIIAFIMFLEVGMLVVITKPASFFLWTTIAIIAVAALYLVRLSLSLIAELKKNNKQ